jgi:hypothetical protein
MVEKSLLDEAPVEKMVYKPIQTATEVHAMATPYASHSLYLV